MDDAPNRHPSLSISSLPPAQRNPSSNKPETAASSEGGAHTNPTHVSGSGDCDNHAAAVGRIATPRQRRVADVMMGGGGGGQQAHTGVTRGGSVDASSRTLPPGANSSTQFSNGGSIPHHRHHSDPLPPAPLDDTGSSTAAFVVPTHINPSRLRGPTTTSHPQPATSTSKISVTIGGTGKVDYYTTSHHQTNEPHLLHPSGSASTTGRVPPPQEEGGAGGFSIPTHFTISNRGLKNQHMSQEQSANREVTRRWTGGH